MRAIVLALVATACVHGGPAPHGPEASSRSYAQALEQGRLDDAYASTTGIDREAFDARYASAADRERRAKELLAAADGQPAPVKLELSGSGWKVVEATQAAEPSDAALAKKALETFLAAVDAQDFDKAYHRLSAPLRARYTPERLKADFSSEPKAKERLERIRASLDGKWQLTADGATLPLGEGKRVKLTREGGDLFVGAIE
ncbi:MAG: hypothetical protein QM723_03965 [Myxococcaceae bacterium]